MKKQIENYYHMFREYGLSLHPEHFAFFDTETRAVEKGTNTDEQGVELPYEYHKLVLGWLILWNRKTNETRRIKFTESSEFWNIIDSELQTHDLILFAHNSEFDVKVTDGYREMFIKKSYELEKIHIQGTVYMLEAKKHGNLLRIYDTMNYAPMSLKKLGKAVGLEKQEIRFGQCSEEKLSEYCLNDTEIIFNFIKGFLSFMTMHDLGKLRPTMGSCAMGAFRTRFYSRKKQPIYIHAHEDCVKLERRSYKGGITDCLQVGTFKGQQYKLDVNSMYPHIMKEKDLPYKLEWYLCENPQQMREKADNAVDSKTRLIICEATISLPKDKAYLLTPFIHAQEQKNGFIHGKFKTVLTTPEYEFARKHGIIHEIHQLAVYLKAPVLREYIEYFYRIRQECKENIRKNHNVAENKLQDTITKGYMNTLFGKWGQKASENTDTGETMPYDDIGIASANVRESISLQYSEYSLMQYGRKIIKIQKTEENSFDSFVAIASHITAYARMYLIEMILAASRENVYYCDTDSIITNREGYQRLTPYIHETELGKLKLEEETDLATYYKPKYYIFNGLKCKGVKRDEKDGQGNPVRITISETPYKWTVKQQQFEKFKTSMAKRHFGKQRIYWTKKIIGKTYDKGKITKGGMIAPYNAKDVIIGKLSDYNDDEQKRILTQASIFSELDEDQFDHHAYEDKTLTRKEQKETKENAIRENIRI